MHVCVAVHSAAVSRTPQQRCSRTSRLLIEPDILTNPFGQAPNPLKVAPTLDNKHSVTQVVSAANGGVVSITGADGSVFTLTIPPNALLSDEAITMTPLTAWWDCPSAADSWPAFDSVPPGCNSSSLLPCASKPGRPIEGARMEQRGYPWTRPTGSYEYRQSTARSMLPSSSVLGCTPRVDAALDAGELAGLRLAPVLSNDDRPIQAPPLHRVR